MSLTTSVKRKTEGQLPVTPTKASSSKKGKTDKMDEDMAASIVNTLTLAIENQGKSTGKLIEEVQRSIDFVSAEVSGMKTKLDKTVRRVKKNEEKIQKLEYQVMENSRYKRRWNLRLRGLPEVEGEEVRSKMINICQNVAPGAKEKLPDVIDSVHRLGPKKHDKPRQGPRAIIIQFTMRHFRDMIWKESKNHEYLRQNNLRFQEDLTQEDRENRERLWPLVQQARQEKKIAYFVGGRAFINGREIALPREEEEKQGLPVASSQPGQSSQSGVRPTEEEGEMLSEME